MRPHRPPERNVNVFLVAPEGPPVLSVEGLKFTPHYDFSNHPAVDILIVPSFENYRNDLDSGKPVLDWIRRTAPQARYVLSNCWGAFLLARAGLLDGRQAMTYPPDIDLLAKLFPRIRTVKGQRFVRDGKFITGAGGVASYDNALYVVEELWGRELARRIASGLVVEWDLDRVPHQVKK